MERNWIVRNFVEISEIVGLIIFFMFLIFFFCYNIIKNCFLSYFSSKLKLLVGFFSSDIRPPFWPAWRRWWRPLDGCGLAFSYPSSRPCTFLVTISWLFFIHYWLVYPQPTNKHLHLYCWSQPCPGYGWVGLGHTVKAPRPLCEGTLRSLRRVPLRR